MAALSLRDPEDTKIVALARATHARAGTRDGACVRDGDGRTYAAAAVDLPSLRLSSLQVAVAMAVSSGAVGLEAAAVVTAVDSLPEAAVDAVRDLGGQGIPIYLADATGTVNRSITT